MKSNGWIPLVDLKRQHIALEEELVGVVREILRQGAFVGGAHVEGFESEWADFCGTRHAVGTGSGSDALRFALLALGIGPGDEVVTVPFTFAATLETILQVGAQPVLVDVDPITCTMDASKLGQRITPRTRAVLPVHLYGHPADMDAIRACAGAHNLAVIEDAAQAHGAVYRDRRAGSLGLVAAFSFYPAKNLGACGEAGAVTTDDAVIAQRVRMLREHGQMEKNEHMVPGFNGKLDAIQAAILRVKLKRLTGWNESRRMIARLYNEGLADIPEIALPHEEPHAASAFHLYVIRTRRRDELRDKLKERGIATGVHYPHPVHLQRSFAFLGHSQGSFPVSEMLADQVLSLPLYPELEPDSVRYICEQIRSIFVSSRSKN